MVLSHRLLVLALERQWCRLHAGFVASFLLNELIPRKLWLWVRQLNHWGQWRKKAVRLNREKTVDKWSPKTPSTTSMGSTEKTPDTSQSSPVQTVLPSSKTPKGKTAKVKMEIRSAKKPTTAAERTRQHLANAKKERLKRLQKFSKPTRVSNAPTKNKCPKSAAKENENTDAAESNKKDATPKGAPRRLIRLKPLATTPPSKKAKKDETAEDHPVAPEPDKAKQDVDDNEVDETQATEEKHRKAHAMYMKYWRSIKSRNCPKEVKKLAKRFRWCKEQSSMLYEDFWKSSCDWRKTTIYRSVTNTIENKKSGRRKWLTRKQMIPIFDNDEAVVDGIILRKRSDPELLHTECRSHPEVPSMYQYLVLVEDSEEASETDRIMDKFSTTERDNGDDDDESSSSDESDGDDDSSDDESGSKKKKKRKTKGKDSKKPKGKTPKSKKKGSKKGSKSKRKTGKGKSGKNKGQNEGKDPEAEKAKEATKLLVKDSKKAISDINNRVRQANDKIKTMTSWSPNIKSAMEKEINGLLARLTRFRSSLQETLDNGSEDATLQKALENAKKGISDFDEKMEPITGKKRKADKSANSGTSKKK
mmetsp:Transcript_84046/g.133226  ORF Transcript_84046/g.133226 Transcript_84046/m.133226 type:complete len:589 (-) Transcript_84046:34-1800(-)